MPYGCLSPSHPDAGPAQRDLAGTADVARSLQSAFLLLTVPLLAGCFGSASAPPRTPDAIGVVATTDWIPNAGRTATFELDSGSRVEIDLASAHLLLGEGAPGTGDLLVTGIDASGARWLFGLARVERKDLPPRCYRLQSAGIGHDGSIDMAIGVRLPKSPDFDPGPIRNDQYTTETYGFCLNSRGEVISYGP